MKHSSKEEAKAHQEDIGGFMDFMEGICEDCGNKRMNCTKECHDKKVKELKLGTGVVG